MVDARFGDILQLETAFRAGVLWKFSGDYDADIFVGSPVMAEALSRMLDAIQAYWSAAGKRPRAESWRDLYVVSNAHRANYEHLIEVMTSYAPRHPKWATLTRREQLDWLQVIAAPYRLDDAGIALFEHILKQ